MRKLTCWAVALGLSSIVAADAVGQAPPAAPPVPSIVVTPPARPVEVRPTGVAATVNGHAIPEVSVYRGLREIPPADQELSRKEILGHLIENTLVDQYLAAIKITVDQKEVTAAIEEVKKELVDHKKDFAKEIENMLMTEAEFRIEVEAQMRWEKFFKSQATDEALKKLFEGSPNVFDGSLVRAKHILLNPGTNPAKQQEAANKLRGIKNTIEIEANKAVAALPPTADALTKETTRNQKIDELFSAYAHQESVCPSKKVGGDLNYFPRVGGMVEEFAKVAFEMKTFQMSDVVPSEFGYHLILVTARKDGSPKKYEDVKDDVRGLYAMRLREAVVAQMKPKAQITITPVVAPAANTTPGVPTSNPKP